MPRKPKAPSPKPSTTESTLEEINRRMDAIETKLNTPPADNPGADALEAIEKEIAELHEQITNLKSAKKQYVGLCHSSMQEFLQSMAATNPNITTESVEWDRFPDGTDKIALPILKTSLDALEDRHVLFVAAARLFFVAFLTTFFCFRDPSSSSSSVSGAPASAFTRAISAAFAAARKASMLSSGGGIPFDEGLKKR